MTVIITIFYVGYMLKAAALKVPTRLAFKFYTQWFVFVYRRV